ncbi:hypothetical protein CCMSSC00406_0006669 [Pleurotus cornucopiae]|uniref:Uncharacterized protein n=1 Tax=Pleurotus cornucopiae TaxID=5321 RepID=A0ACB7IS86_PLECO|nr:hypothetical protein CCMSSC00406_0006669 [Pleurotus cornucopiae]
MGLLSALRLKWLSTRPYYSNLDGWEAKEGLIPGNDTNSEDTLTEEQPRPRSSRTLWYIIIAQSCALTALFTILASNSYIRREGKWLYSPAQDAISYKYYRFFNGFEGDISPFQAPPSAELDARWAGLYDFGISRIPRFQAARLPNRTEEIPGDEGNFIIELDVFHEIHCLNQIRKALYPDHYPDMRMDDPSTAEHVNHCIDSIRQSLMCSSDVSTIVWQWDAAVRRAFPKGSVVHRCRDFERIKEWALERRTKEKYNTSLHVANDLVIPVIYD